ncbi:MAG: hypothetical protein DI586_04495 [Micavibrio aeruginosavorus]|uniref:Uncharacterized protein n=1 Tax=Micavibrio aeruginosavorus TaxID=349221 RepID=A0A2W5HR44_9BACT|nr:MAG: hypothetical protein DI586_04495 [Micavibrio aeruginosavorus]
MQNELSSRIEKIWSMAEVALKHGYIDYGTNGHSKVVRLSGLTFKFIGDTLSRVRGPRLDIAITHHEPQDGVVFFPGAETILHFLCGDDDVLNRNHIELLAMHRTFSVKAA